MKPFVFRLDSVLKIRAREEAQAQEQLDHAIHARFRAQQELNAAHAELDRCEMAITEKRSGRSTGGDHVVFLNAARMQRECCDRLAARLEAAKKEMESRRQFFQTARRKLQAVEKLRERQLRTHNATEQRREENAISDLIISRHSLNRDDALA